MNRPDGPHEGNPAARESVKAGNPQVLAWACQREDGGRGFGFTGGHFHSNWGIEAQRRMVVNAILWTAKTEIPKTGARCAVTEQDLAQNLDAKK